MAVAVFERWGLNPREQRAAGVAVLVLMMMVILGIPVGLQALVANRRAENEELRHSLEEVNNARGDIRQRQERKASIAQRYAKKAPQLGGFIEQSAGQQKLQVTDSVDRPDIPQGKKYVERNTVIHFKKVGMGPLAKFLEALERSGYPLSVSRINIRKRSGEPDSYDIEIGLSAFDRNDTSASANTEKKP